MYSSTSSRKGFLAANGHVGFVLGFVPNQVVRKDVCVFGRPVRREGPVRLVNLSFPEHFVKTLQRFGRFGKQHHATYGPVQPVGDTHKHLAGLAVPLRDEGLQGFTQGFVPGLVSLYNLSRPLVENEQMVVFQQNPLLDVPELFRT